MTDEETQSVTEEVAPPQEPEPQQDDPKEEVQPTPEPKRGDQEYNWRETRRKLEAMESQNRELKDKIDRMSGPQKNEDDDLAKLADDDIVTAKQARSLAAKMARQVADEVVRQREVSTLDERLKTKFPDFDSIVTRENIETLKQNEPELAMSLNAISHDPYAQATAAYKILKKHGFGVSEDVVKNKARAEANSKKPVSVQTVTKQSSAIGNAYQFENGLTPELKKQLWKDMQDCAKRA